MFRNRSENTRRKGFTVIEMTIVVAVLAILAAVLIPTFINTHEQAEMRELQTTIRDSYTNFANSQLTNGGRADPIGSYRFVRAEGVELSGGVAIGLKNPTDEYRWDGDEENAPVHQNFGGLGNDTLFAEKYGEFYILWSRSR